MSMVFGAHEESHETLTDDDLALIFQFNNKSKLGSVAPRVLEPLISLTLSEDPMELLYAAKYIRELVWCTSISYPRVQFQALWALANLSQKRDLSLTQFEGNEGLMEMAESQGVVLKPGQDLGDKFREMIVSTEYISRSVDDDAVEMMEKTEKEIGLHHRHTQLESSEHDEPSVLRRRLSRAELERDLGGGLNRKPATVGLLSDADESGGNHRRFGDSQDSSRTRSNSNLELTNAGYQRRSTANNIRASLVHHGMADVVRRMSISGQHGLIDGIGDNHSSRHNSEDRYSTTDFRQDDLSDTDSVDLVRDTVDMTFELEKDETPKTVDRKSSTQKLFAMLGDDEEEPPPNKPVNVTGTEEAQSSQKDIPIKPIQKPSADEDDIDDLFTETNEVASIVDENVLGGLRVIYSGFRDMNETVKMEALAVMVNLSLSEEVADSLVFHQGGDTLAHLLELIWAPCVFTKFATLVLVNLATTDKRRRVILRSGGLAAVIGLLLGSDYDLQVAACRCLVNLALSPAHHVPLLASSVFIERLLAKLAPVDHPETQMLVATLVRNMCTRLEFARALNNPEHKTFDRLKKLRDSSTMDKKNSEESDEVSKMIMFTVNSLSEFKQREETAAGFMKKLPPRPPITAQVTWDTWNSKLDRMWNPVLSISPLAKGRHIHVPTAPHHEDIKLQAEDTHGNELRYRIVTKPLCGTLVKPEGEEKNSNLFRYTPYNGYTGTDYFTFIASNSVMDSNLGTVSIKVDTSLTGIRQKEEEMRLAEEKKVEEAKKATLDALLTQSKIIVPKKKADPKQRESKSLMSLLSFVREAKDEDEVDPEDDAVKRRSGHPNGDSDDDDDDEVGRESVTENIQNLSDSVCQPVGEEGEEAEDGEDGDVRITVDLGSDNLDLEGEPSTPTASESWSGFGKKGSFVQNNESSSLPAAPAKKTIPRPLPASSEFEV